MRTAVEQLFTDFVTGVRILWRAPGLSATAAILIALVIGGNTTVFSVVHGILTKPAAGVAADRLASIGWLDERGEVHPGGSYPDYVDVAASTRTLASMLAFQFDRFILGARDGSYAIEGLLVSRGYFETLGVRPALGRTFSDEETRGSAGLVAVISHRVWRERFGASAGVVGQSMILNGHAATIVGVAPERFQGVWLGEQSDVWVPIEAYATIEGRLAQLHDRGSRLVASVARLAPGVSLSEARAELAAISRQLPRMAAGKPSPTIVLAPYSATAAGDSVVAQRGPWFLAMFSIVTALTLVLVGANVANLMLARAIVRAREMAVRQSLGASRLRIVRIFAAEGVAVSFVAWVLAALVAAWTTSALPEVIPPLDGGRAQIAFDFTPDWTVLGYAMLLAVAATVLFSAAPALRSSRLELQPLLKAGEQGVVQGRSSVSRGLVALQLAFSVLLLTTAGLAYRSLSMLTTTDFGFARDHLALATVNTRSAATTNDANAALLGGMLERVRTIPGVVAASYAHRPIQSFWGFETLRVHAGDPGIEVERNAVGPGFFGALGVVPRLGRDVDRGQAGGSVPAAINAGLAASLWPGEPAVGQALRLASTPKPIVIAAVVPDGFYNGYRRQRDPNFLFVSAEQAPPPPGEITLYIKHSGAFDAVARAIGPALRSVDDRAPLVYVRTMETQLEGLTWPIHALTILLTLFAAGSLVIATVGQYAAMAFATRRRVRDFGIRMALGASASDIRVSVVREGARLTALGLAAGLVLSLAAARGARSMLYGITPTDARTYAAVFGILALASLVACYLPAHRASRIDPMDALRQE